MNLHKRYEIENVALNIDRLASDCLLSELNLELKPGLVCPSSNGSHSDMNYLSFIRSIESLKGYFAQFVVLGYHQAAFSKLKELGILAEKDMLEATKGINTHKGAIFNLGLCCAALGRCLALKKAIKPEIILQELKTNWKQSLLFQLNRNPQNHGQIIRKQYGLTGAIEEAASGFLSVQQYALSTLRNLSSFNLSKDEQYFQTLMSLIANLNDTNLVWRGGLDSLYFAQHQGKAFLKPGGVFNESWEKQASQIQVSFISHNLSPGGSADLLSVAIFLHRLENEYSSRI